MSATKKLRVVHYINQFYAGIGGEEKADHKPEIREGVVGPGVALKAVFGNDAEITHTVICGDGYFNENLETAKKELISMIKGANPDLFVAGPAFNAGRYGVACGTICDLVQKELGIATVSGMYRENPGVDMYKKDVYIIETNNSAVDMKNAAPKMAKLGLKLARKEEIGASIEEGYLPGMSRINFFDYARGSKRAVDMLLKKLAGQPFVTEYPMPDFDRVEPGKPIKDMKKATIALVTSGGIVPKGNPDHIESSSASKYGEYDIKGVNDLTEKTHETAHGGYDPLYANQDSDRVLPVDVLRDLEKEGKIGKLHNLFYTTTGNGTSIKNSREFAAEFAQKLVAAKVDAVILTST